MTQLTVHPLLASATVRISDIRCRGECRHRSDVECSAATRLVFPYRGIYVRHVGRDDAIAEANQLLFFNGGEEYRVSHPVEGGDGSIELVVAEDFLRELAPRDQLADGEALGFRRQRRRIDPRAQVLVALLRHGLVHRAAEPLEAETLALTLVRRSLGERTSHSTATSYGRQKLVDRTKVALSADLARRWSLGEIGAEMGVSAVYLPQIFRQVEGGPLYQYQLRLRLARSLDLLATYDDLTTLAMDLGFSSHSHFTAIFRQTYGCSPAEFQRSTHLRRAGVGRARVQVAKDPESRGRRRLR